MKLKKIFVYICSVALACLFNACSDDDDKIVGPEIPQALEFTFTPMDVTITSFDFNLKVDNQEAPYVCLYVPRTVIDRVPKYELSDFLMDDLRKQAETANESFEQYLAEISHKGDKDFHLENLQRGTLYEIVAFSVNKEWKSEETSFFFFHTLRVTPVDCSFEVKTYKEDPFKFTVIPSNKEAKWHLEVLSKDWYEELLQNDYDDATILMDYLSLRIDEGYDKAREDDGIVDSKEAQDVIDSMFIQGDRDLKLTAQDMPENSEYRWILAAFDQFEWYISIVSEVQSGSMILNATENGLKASHIMTDPSCKPWIIAPRRYLPKVHPVK